MSGSVPPGRLTRVSRRFGDVRAVDEVSLDIEDGEFFSMLGPSGSGKTTCLRLIAGFEEPSTGKIELHGVEAAGLPPYERDVNTVFQDYALFPHMSVEENVGYGLMIRRVPRAERERRGPERLGLVRPPRGRGPPAGPALGRAAPACGPRPRPHQPPACAPPRRATGRPRPQAARADAGRAEGDPAASRDHLSLRDPPPTQNTPH